MTSDRALGSSAGPQPLVEEVQNAIDGDLLAVGSERRMALALELDLEEAVPEQVGERVEPGAGGRVAAVSHTHDSATCGHPTAHHLAVGRAESEVPGSGPAHRDGQGWLGDD